MPRKKQANPTRIAPVIKPVSPVFRLTFLSVVGLTGISLLVSLIIASLPEHSSEAKQVLDACLSTWKMGFGVILGLIGGKAIK
jgi:hypothetical protein